MNTERLFLLDPYNNSHLEKITVFEGENNTIDKLSDYIKELRKNVSKEEYYNPSKNEIDEIIFTEKNNRITDCCCINGVKDRKQCNITPLNINNKSKKRHLVDLAATYSIDTLGMEEVFVKAKEEDQSMINYLELKGFENLGEDNGSIILLKERETKEEVQRMIA